MSVPIDVDLERLAVVTSAYTGVLCAESFAAVHKYAETLLGRSVYTHEFADEEVWEAIKEASKPEFLRLWGLTR